MFFGSYFCYVIDYVTPPTSGAVAMLRRRRVSTSHLLWTAPVYVLNVFASSASNTKTKADQTRLPNCEKGTPNFTNAICTCALWKRILNYFRATFKINTERKTLFCLFFLAQASKDLSVSSFYYTRQRKFGVYIPSTLTKQTERKLHKISKTFLPQVVANFTWLTQILQYTVLSPSIWNACVILVTVSLWSRFIISSVNNACP